MSLVQLNRERKHPPFARAFFSVPSSLVALRDAGFCSGFVCRDCGSFLLFLCFPGVQQRMTALKRAYADIIFNTTEESATRILASERRALQLQQNLSLVKEESLTMLLRLKAIMEAKVLPLSYRSSHWLLLFSYVFWQDLSSLDFISRCTRFSAKRFLGRNWLIIFGH